MLSLPPAVAHELTHWAVARIGTDEAVFAVEVSGGRAVAAWPPLQSRALRVFAFMAPTFFGVILSILWAYHGVTLDGWRSIMALGLLLYSIPSAGDVRGAAGLQDSQTDKQTSSQSDSQ